MVGQFARTELSEKTEYAVKDGDDRSTDHCHRPAFNRGEFRNHEKRACSQLRNGVVEQQVELGCGKTIQKKMCGQQILSGTVR